MAVKPFAEAVESFAEAVESFAGTVEPFAETGTQLAEAVEVFAEVVGSQAEVAKVPAMVVDCPAEAGEPYSGAAMFHAEVEKAYVVAVARRAVAEAGTGQERRVLLDVVVTEDIDRSLLGTVDDCIPGRLVRVVVVAAAEGALAECTAAAEPALAGGRERCPGEPSQRDLDIEILLII